MDEYPEDRSGFLLDVNERQVLADYEFLLAKNRVMEKARLLLENTGRLLTGYLQHGAPDLPAGVSWQACKVSRGENYRGLPYLVLDCPRAFDKEDIFTYRTMLWWGHEFSTTLHLQGTYLDLYRKRLSSSLADLSDYYVGCGDSPWEYHFGKTNYQPVNTSDNTFLKTVSEGSFLKLSRRWALSEWENMPGHTLDTWKSLSKIVFE
ncbi:MAG: hypothetical protein WBB45_05420 [Cyclobacteriaceae bacterium]